MSQCGSFRADLGAYAVGALDDDDARHVADHLESCEVCRSEYAMLEAGAALLRAPVASTLAPAEIGWTLADRALDEIASHRRTERRRLRVTAIAVLTGAVGSVIATVAFVGMGRGPADPLAPTGPTIAARAASDVGASAEIRLSERPWGTQVDLNATGMPVLAPGEFYAVWLADADGRRVPAGTFRSSSATVSVRMRLAAAVPRIRVVRVGVTRESGPASTNVLSASTG